MKILVVAQYYRPDITAAAFRIAETVDLLVAAGQELTVVTSEPHRAQAAGGVAASAVTTAAEELSDPRILRVPIDPLTGSGMRPYLRHFFSFVLRARRSVRKLLRSGYHPDVIWVSSPPLFVGLVGSAARRWSGAPLVLDIRDVWPDTAVAAGQISGDGRAYRFGRRLEHWLYRRADAFSCVAAPMAEYLRREIAAAGSSTAAGAAVTGAASHASAVPPVPPIAVVYNGAGFSVPPPVPAPEVRKTVLYAGNLGRLQGIESLLEGWARLGEVERAGWTLELIGTGVLEEELQAQAAALQITDTVRFRGVLPKEFTVEETRHAGILFLNLLARPVFDLTIPSKLFDYLATARPIIGGITGEGRDILHALPGNHTVRPNDSDEIAAALRQLIGGESWNTPLPENQRIVTERYSRAVNTATLLALFTTVTRR